MAGGSGPPPSAEPAELERDRCPNCGGKLKFSENRPEGLCSACGIFVEVLRPNEADSQPSIQPLPSKMKIRTATTEELLVLCRKYGLPSDGQKADLVDRLLYFVDDQSWRAKVREKEVKPPPAPSPDDVEGRKRWATFFMNYESELGEEGTDARDEEAAHAQPSPGESPQQPAEPASEPRVEPPPVEPVSAPPPEETHAAKPPDATPVDTPREIASEPPETLAEAQIPGPPVEDANVPPPPTRDDVPEIPPPPPAADQNSAPALPEESALVAERTLHAEVIAERVVRPLITEAAMPAIPAPQGWDPRVQSARNAHADVLAPTAQRSRWRRAVYYVGVFYVSIGGAGLILMSYLHDLLRVPLFGQAYDAFGRLNELAFVLGTFLLVVGVAAMAVGMHRIPLRTRSATEG